MKLYLVVFLTKSYLQDFLLLHSDSVENVTKLTSSLDKVLDVISVWEEAK